MNEPALICFCYSRFVFSWIYGLCYSDLCYSAFSDLSFPFSFPNIRKYFSKNFLQCNQTPWKHFPFPKISISGKYVFSGKRFTATKHSLSWKEFHLSQVSLEFMRVLLGYTYTMWISLSFNMQDNALHLAVHVPGISNFTSANAFRPTKEIKLVVQERMYK